MLQWIAILKSVLDLTTQAHECPDIPYKRNKLFGLIRYYAPEQQKALEQIIAEQQSPVKFQEQLLDLLIRIPENERTQIVQHIGKDLSKYFPEACEDLCSIELFNNELPAIRYQKNLIKLNRYLTLTDRAILRGKYYLAYKLTYRCLKEYYRIFQNKHHIQVQSDPKDISHTSISVYHYILKQLTKYGNSAPTKNLLYFSMVSQNLTEEEQPESQTKEEKKAYENQFDRLYAEYAKDNVQKIIRYISKYF